MIQNAKISGHDLVLQNCTGRYIDSFSMISNDDDSTCIQKQTNFDSNDFKFKPIIAYLWVKHHFQM